MKNKLSLLFVMLLAGCMTDDGSHPHAGSSHEYYVSPDGSDSSSGTRQKPFATLARAQQAARHTKGGLVIVCEGIYYLPETLVFTPEDSGTEYRAVAEGKVVLSGGMKLDLKWTAWRDGVFQARVPTGLEMDQLWINGQRQWMARFPNRETGEDLNVFDTWKLDQTAKADPSRDPLAAGRVARWADPTGGYFHALHPALWGGVQWRITGRKADGSLAMEGGTQNNRGSAIHPLYRMVENIFEELDAPGEWFHDRKSSTLYYYPLPGADLSKATVEVVRLRHLIELRGSEQQPVKQVAFRGFTFRHTARTFMDTREPLLRSDWTTYRGGAVFLAGAEECSVKDCTFDQVGGNTIFVSGYNRRITIQGCLIENSGANGIAFVGEVNAVRSPLLNYDDKFDYAKLDRTPGPLTADYPADCLVEDCLITRIGRVEKQTAGVQIAMAQGITVRHCSIYDVPRAGINIGDGCWGGHVIEHCDIFDTVKETGDHGSFNSWGRDRYWHADRKVVNREVAADPTLPLLDVVKPITLRNNRWRCDHGWDVDLDDGSSNYRIYNNLFLNGGLKLREGYDRQVWNNIAINNSLHPHVWFADSGDVVTNNIWMGAYRPAIMPGGSEKWGRVIDFNLFTSDKDRRSFLANGCDVHSLVGDPLFLNPAKGDFRVRNESPALKLGFKNFSMNQFGVEKPALKARAKTPTIPTVSIQVESSSAELSAGEVYQWQGATLRQISGEEYSAFGVGREAGGVVLLKVPKDSQAARGGLLAGDLIQNINGESARTMQDALRILHVLSGKVMPVELQVIRNQSPLYLKTIPPQTVPTLIQSDR